MCGAGRNSSPLDCASCDRTAGSGCRSYGGGAEAMTTEWISGIEHRLQHITTLIEELPAAPGGPGMAETKQLLSTIGSCLRDVETGLFENRPSAKLLGALAGCRKSVREASGILDEARSAAA